MVLSGGYEDDRDEGEWFLYTGSGGRDLSGNRRTNKVQSSDQKFEKLNEALRVSCLKGYPVRVVRSFKEKRSSYAPPDTFSTGTSVRYDGVYRIISCWRKKGEQGMLMCRYLFVRCDNEPAPWSSEESGDKPFDVEKDIPEAALQEMALADKDKVYTMEKNPWWDWNEEKKAWGWAKLPPESQAATPGNSPAKAARKKITEQERALRDMKCGICKNVLRLPVTAPCTHSFCKPCLDVKFGGLDFEVDAGIKTGRSLRIRKVNMPCPCSGCKADLADFLKTAQVNRDLEAMIAKLQDELKAAKEQEAEEDRIAKEEDEETSGDGDAGMEDKEDSASQLSVGSGSTALQKKRKNPAASSNGKSPNNKKVKHSNNEDAEDNKDDDDDDAVIETTPVKRSVVGAGRLQTDADRREEMLSMLCSEFPDLDAELIAGVFDEECDGDVRDAKVLLSKLRDEMVAAEKKQAKKAKKDGVEI